MRDKSFSICSSSMYARWTDWKRPQPNVVRLQEITEISWCSHIQLVRDSGKIKMRFKSVQFHKHKEYVVEIKGLKFMKVNGKMNVNGKMKVNGKVKVNWKMKVNGKWKWMEKCMGKRKGKRIEKESEWESYHSLITSQAFVTLIN